MRYFSDINSHKYIYLVRIEEPEDNSLRIVIEEAVVSSNIETVTEEESGVTEGCVIKTTENCLVYELVFDSYIGYSVLDESFALPDDEDVFEGRIFCIYKKSNYLDFLKKVSFACDEHPGPFKHFGLNCLNHVIDIASTDEPYINLLSKK